MSKVRAYACNDTSSQFHPHTIELSDPGPKDVLFDVKYAGICHSDIHQLVGSGARRSIRSCRGMRLPESSPRSATKLRNSPLAIISVWGA